MQPIYITDFLKINARDNPSKDAFICRDKHLTWGQLEQEVTARANYIVGVLGTDEPKIVAILMPNTWQFVVAYLAVVEAGHIAMPIDVIYKPLEINAIAAQAQSALFITDRANMDRIDPAAGAVAFEGLPANSSSTKRLRLPPNEQIASLVFTSGTTGVPKMAPYTHSNHIWNIKVCSEVWDWSATDTNLLSLRLSHWYGICLGLTGALYHGNTVYLDEAFDAEATLRQLASGTISLFTHTPLAYAKMLEVPGEFDLSAVRVLISGSAPLPPAVWKAFKDRFGIEIIECYGSSETGRIAANSLADRQPGSPGRLLSEVETAFGDGGELLVKSPGLFPGYYKNPEATARNMTPQGYWRTGDIAELNDGRLILKGRLQERIRKQGYTLSPRDIEWALLKNPDIRECAVVGIAGSNGDDQLVYFIAGNTAAEQVDAFTRANLPSVWRPDRMIFLEALPRTSNGKISLLKLRAML